MTYKTGIRFRIPVNSSFSFMKKIFVHVLFVLLTGCIAYLSGFISQYGNDPYSDISPYASSKNLLNEKNLHSESDTTSINFPYPVKWNFNYSGIENVNGGTVGAVLFKGKYYFNRWNTNPPTCYTFDASGPGGSPDSTTLDSIVSPPYIGQVRDMTIAPDGSGEEFLWGGQSGNVLYKMDEDLNVVSTFTIPGAEFRAITWDPNRKGFWSANFTTPIFCYDTTGNIIDSLGIGILYTGKYGLAWDSLSSADSAFLWIWNQGGGTGYNDLHKIHLASKTETAVYSFYLPGASSGIAGGANILVQGEELLLYLNFQNLALVCYTLHDLSYDCNTSFSRGELNKSIPDNNIIGIYDTLTVQEHGTIGHLEFIIDTIKHTWVGDLTATLTHNGIQETLMERPGPGVFGTNGDHFFGTRLRDHGDEYIDSITAFDAPFTSPPSYKPGGPHGIDSLSKFTGADMYGDWILHITDGAPGDKGQLVSWSLCMESNSVGINNGGLSNPELYSLKQNYPNPFNPSTSISFTIPARELVTLKIYDLLGKEIYTLINETREAGTYTSIFNGENLPIGVYFYRIQAGDYSQVKKMILMK